MRDFIAENFKFQPYWWEAAPPLPHQHPTIEPQYDVAIIGSGFTGASAAIPLARAGLSVAMFDKDDPGAGASRRAAGFMGRVLKKSYGDLVHSKGEKKARATYLELNANFEFTLDLIAKEGIDCFADRPGRFIGATSPGHYSALEADLTLLRQALGYEFRMVPRAHQHDEMATDAYWGGAVIPDNGCLHPGLYHKGLLDRAIDAGAHVFGQTEVIKLIDLGDKGHKLQTNRGTLRARQVIIATNGYTPKSLNWYSRRLIPFRAFMAATEELPEDLMTKLIPNRRTIIDSNANIDFFRPAPDSRRIIFGGATTEKLDGPEAIAKRMKQILGRILPDARDVRLSHVWDGYCAATFDMMPHLGSRGTIHHAVGYNFAGITTGTVFGRLLAQRILGQASNGSVFENGSFPTIPFYSGTPWFLGLVMRYFAWHDQQIARKAANS